MIIKKSISVISIVLSMMFVAGCGTTKSTPSISENDTNSKNTSINEPESQSTESVESDQPANSDVSSLKEQTVNVPSFSVDYDLGEIPVSISVPEDWIWDGIGGFRQNAVTIITLFIAPKGEYPTEYDNEKVLFEENISTENYSGDQKLYETPNDSTQYYYCYTISDETYTIKIGFMTDTHSTEQKEFYDSIVSSFKIN